MTNDISKREFYEGVFVDIEFGDPKPIFGDVFLLCGVDHPAFTPSGNYQFDQLADLQFSQVDDYFGIRSLADDGDDVIVWLFPLIDGECVDHHPGPFDGLRLEYNVLRNPTRHVEHFLRCIMSIAELSDQSSPDIDSVRSRIGRIVEHWQTQGVVVGSDDALKIDN